MSTSPGRRRLSGVLALAALALVLAVSGASPAAAEAPDEDHQRTLGLVASYRNAPNWVVKSIALLSLGERWHPAGAEIVLDGLRSKDRRLRAFAMEALRATPGPALRATLTAELLDELINRQLAHKNRHYHALVLICLMNAFPDVGALRVPWAKWWRGRQVEYAPTPWVERPAKKDKAKGADTVSRKSVVQRALELSQDGIELVLCFDSTGSMQPTINAARSAMTHVISILEGLSPELRVGVVHYKDRYDFSGKGDAHGAKVISRLTGNSRSITKALDRLQAGGGGDLPERVYAGLWLSLHRDMGWTLPAAKMVVVLGDAPPHEADVEPSLEIVRVAREEPTWKLDKRWERGLVAPVVTSKRPKKGRPPPRVNPILTSCIVTGPGMVDPQAASRLRKIATVGGGVFAKLLSRNDPDATSAQIVKHLVELTFGGEYREAAERLAERYVFWRKKGFFK